MSSVNGTLKFLEDTGENLQKMRNQIDDKLNISDVNGNLTTETDVNRNSSIETHFTWGEAGMLLLDRVVIPIFCLLVVICVIVSLHYLTKKFKKQPSEYSGHLITNVPAPVQRAQRPIQRSVAFDRNIRAENKKLIEMNKKAIVEHYKKVKYSSIPKIFVEDGTEVIELKDLGRPNVPSCSEDLNLNVTQAEVEVHAENPISKKCQFMEHKNDYHLLNINSDCLEIDTIPEETEKEDNV